MHADESTPQPRPVRVPRAAHALIRKVNPEPNGGPPPLARVLTIDGETWLARPAGESAAGTGHGPPAFLVAIHFFRAEDPDRPLREALLPLGRFEGLYDEELVALFRRARPLPPPE